MRNDLQDWAGGALIAVAMGLVYFAVRPPLFDLDGYQYYLAGLGPEAFHNVNPHHLLWIPIQMLLLTVADWLGYKTRVPFEIFGILVNCATLFLFYVLLLETGRNRLFAVAGALLVAFSPRFWYLGFQNEPYPLMFLAVVLYLHAWHTKDGGAPVGLRLVASGLCLSAAIFMQQGAAFLVPAGALALMLFGTDAPRQRLMRAVAWGAGISAIVVPVYVWIWAATADQSTGFWSFITNYLETLHSLQFQFPTSLIKTVMGIAGAVLQSDQIQDFLFRGASTLQLLLTYLLALRYR
jgi:4-amino-4-deoxy-L-arabinose transferase-like glycosyltransferase